MKKTEVEVEDKHKEWRKEWLSIHPQREPAYQPALLDFPALVQYPPPVHIHKIIIFRLGSVALGTRISC